VVASHDNAGSAQLIQVDLDPDAWRGRRMNKPLRIDDRFSRHRVAEYQRFVVRGVWNGHAEVNRGDAPAVHLGPQAECVCEVRGAHRTGEAPAQSRAGSHKRGASGRDDQREDRGRDGQER